MVFDTTYTDKEITIEINKLAGRPYSLIQRLKLGGIGSHRIIIDQASDDLEKYINPGHSINHVNFELRPLALLAHLKRRTQTFCWVIPYINLEMTEDYQMISDSVRRIALKEPLRYNQDFFKKVERLKTNQ